MREHLRSALTDWIASLQRIVGLLDELGETDWSEIDYIMDRARHAFEDSRDAARWMVSLHPSLGTAPLASFLAGHGAEVIRLLAREKRRQSALGKASAARLRYRRQLRERFMQHSSETTLGYQYVKRTDSRRTGVEGAK